MNLNTLLQNLSTLTSSLYLIDKEKNIVSKYPSDKLLSLEIEQEKRFDLIDELDKHSFIPLSETNSYGGIKLSSAFYIIASFDISKIANNTDAFNEKCLGINTLLKTISDIDEEEANKNPTLDEKTLVDFLAKIQKDITISTPSLDAVIQEDSQHNTYAYESSHLEAIVEGDPDKAVRALRSPMHGKEGRMGFTELRHAKNSAIINATLAARAAIKGGIPVESAYTTADFFILSAELTKTPEDAFLLREATSYKFAQLVQEYTKKKTNKYRSNVIKIIEEIERKLFTKISREELVTVADLNEDYAERIFKEDVGLSIMDYLRTQRIAKAKDLLLNSTLKVGDIAFLLQFSSTSHFARVFKKVTNTSPLEYKEQNYIKAQTPAGSESI